MFRSTQTCATGGPSLRGGTSPPEGGPPPRTEGHPLDRDAEGDRAISVGGVAALEDAVLGAAPLVGVVLRLGHLYSPGTGRETPEAPIPVHVDAAAHAALLAMAGPASGVFNIVEADPAVSDAKSVESLGWRAGFRLVPEHRRI